MVRFAFALVGAVQLAPSHTISEYVRARDGNLLPPVPILAVREMQLADAGRAQEYKRTGRSSSTGARQKAKADAAACPVLPPRSMNTSRRW